MDEEFESELGNEVGLKELALPDLPREPGPVQNAQADAKNEQSNSSQNGSEVNKYKRVKQSSAQKPPKKPMGLTLNIELIE